MKKLLVSIVILGASAFSVFSRTVPVSQAVAVLPVAKATTTPPLSSAPSAPASSPPAKSGYQDGTYTGSMADAYYGMVEVQATVKKGSLADVAFLSYPNDRDTSRFINGQAMPMLTSEAISAQSANVNIISGATDTSLAFRQSLASALKKAHG